MIRRLYMMIAPVAAVVMMFAVAVSMCGCAVHQWPEQKEEPLPPTPDDDKTEIALRLEYEPDLYLWEHKYDPVLGSVEETYPDSDIYPDYPGASLRYANVSAEGYVEVCVRAFPTAGASRSVAEHTFVMPADGVSYDTEFRMELPDVGAYDIVVWSHLLHEENGARYYDPSDFNRVSIISDNYSGNTDLRDGFRGRISVEAVKDEAEGDGDAGGEDGVGATKAAKPVHTVLMRRPMGKFELVTTDLSEFLDRETVRRSLPTRARAEDYRVVISFPYYYPSSYSAMEDRLENSSAGVSFETRMTVTGVSEASLGFEYVMLNDTSESGVQTQVNVYDLDGNRVAGSAMFTVPMRRDNHTLLRGAFLSLEGNGGVGIDPGFNGDHNLPLWQ